MRQLKKLAVTTALVAAVPALASAQHLVYGSFVPASDYLNAVALPEIFADITEATNGEVTWELIVGGQLADGQGTLPAVEDRMMDAGLAIAAYAPSVVPHLAFLYSIVVPGDDVVSLAAAATETIFQDCPGCLADMQSSNAIPFGGYSNAVNSLMCTRPVATLADMDGLRIRANGGFADMVAAAGATPMALTLAETVTVLQRGGMECVVGAAEWLATYSYGDSAKFVSGAGLGSSSPALGLYLNRDAFHDLSPEGQDAVFRASAKLSIMQTLGNFVIKNAESLQNQIDTNGVQIVPPADDLAAHFATYPLGDRDARIAAGNQLGVQDPAAVYDAYMANVEKWRAITAEVGQDVDALAARLYDEVFADLDPASL